jgi:hypothetical protein
MLFDRRREGGEGKGGGLAIVGSPIVEASGRKIAELLVDGNQDSQF